MYRVIKLYGDCEPWWFLEGWEEDIVSMTEFPIYEDALAYFQKEWQQLANQFFYQKSHTSTMISFWDPTDKVWCEECVEYLQQYHSLLLLENLTPLPINAASIKGTACHWQ